MTSPAKTSPIIFVAVMLTGCILSRPQLSIDAAGVSGTPRRAPAIIYSVTPWQEPDTVVRVLSLPDRKVVRSFPGHKYTEGLVSTDADQPARFEPPSRIPLFGLPAGNYAAELWVKGKLESTLDFSTNGDPQGRIANPAVNAVARLDQLVHLSSEQRKAATRIFEEERDDLAAAPPEERAALGREIRQIELMRIGDLLTAEQRKIWEATPQNEGGARNAGPAVISPINRDAPNRDDVLRDVLAPEQANISEAAPEIESGVKLEDPANLPAANRGRNNITAVQAYVADYLKLSPTIAARLGTITRVTPVSGSWRGSTWRSNGRIVSTGSYLVNVQGSASSETLTIYWERASPSDPVTIRVEGKPGEVIAK